jgi:hypothetical protein
MKTQDPNVPQSQAASWKSIRKEQPTWYTPVDVITPDGVIHEGWARVSNGDYDYYVSIEPYIDTIIPKIKKWRYRS